MPLSHCHRRQFAWAAAALGGAAVLPGWSQRSNPARGPVTVAVGGLDTFYHLPLMVAHSLGFFALEGLDVRLQTHAGGALARDAMLHGRAQVCSGAYEHVLHLHERGVACSAFVQQGRTPQMALAVSARSPAAALGLAGLRGATVGVSAPGSFTHRAACLMLQRAGVPVEAVHFVGVGGAASAMQAWHDGRVQALCHADPVISLLEQLGDARVLCDLRTQQSTLGAWGGAVPSGCLYAREAFVAEQPAVVQSLTHAMVHALKWLQTATPGDLAQAVPREALLGQRTSYLKAFARMRDSFSPDGLMPQQASLHLRRLRTALDGAAPGADLADLADMALARTYTNRFARAAKARFAA